MAEKWLAALLDEHAPGWRKNVRCPVCKGKIHPLEVSKHLRAVHGIETRQPQERSKP
jgi:hypothetical protein